MIHELSEPPMRGKNEQLADWAMACAATTEKYYEQMNGLRGLEHD